ncbi:hypothetical protein FTV88_1371 [Heliorestis convoluta]|uniref:Uncharacterized protein n=1 Tax=Heliorestis convoluta TaxID=356322 RepID=A0A5Q2MXV8_9FIRM|nr:hypothetical protein FTV88_1371 [Heliorestis convoluta]
MLHELQNFQSQLNELALDDSFWAKSRKTEFNNRIDSLRQEINKLQAMRERQLRIENLERMLY